MAIERKELAQLPRFEGVGKFVYARHGDGVRSSMFTFEFFGGQVSIEVTEEETLSPPAVGVMFLVSGTLQYNSFNGSVRLIAKEKRKLAESDSQLTDEQWGQYVTGLSIGGVGIVEAKSSTVFNRQTFNKATLKWQGAIHEFRSLSPEIYSRVPSVGQYVRFKLGLLVGEERRDGQSVVVQKPSLVGCQLDSLVTGSVPSASANAAAAPPKPAASAPPKV
jgi:hypothetical protein